MKRSKMKRIHILLGFFVDNIYRLFSISICTDIRKRYKVELG